MAPPGENANSFESRESKVAGPCKVLRPPKWWLGNIFKGQHSGCSGLTETHSTGQQNLAISFTCCWLCRCDRCKSQGVLEACTWLLSMTVHMWGSVRILARIREPLNNAINVKSKWKQRHAPNCMPMALPCIMLGMPSFRIPT